LESKNNKKTKGSEPEGRFLQGGISDKEGKGKSAHLVKCLAHGENAHQEP
jgi:hypothetical protein